MILMLKTHKSLLEYMSKNPLSKKRSHLLLLSTISLRKMSNQKRKRKRNMMTMTILGRGLRKRRYLKRQFQNRMSRSHR